MALPAQYAWLSNEPGPKMILEALKLFGTVEAAGAKDNPTILAWAVEVGLAKTYSHDSIPWCGLFVAVVAKRAGKEVVDSPLWALSWAEFGKPAEGGAMLGDVLTFKRDGGGHVALYCRRRCGCLSLPRRQPVRSGLHHANCKVAALSGAASDLQRAACQCSEDRSRRERQAVEQRSLIRRATASRTTNHPSEIALFLSLRLAVPAAMLAVLVATYLIGPIVPLVVAVALFVYAYVPLDRARWVPAVGFVIVALAPNFAFAATIDVGQALTGGLVEGINGAIAALITAAVGYVTVIFRNKFNIEIEAKHREALTAFLQRQASGLVAKGAVKVQGLKIEVASDAVAVAANTALHAAPDALKFFGLTPEALQKRIIDLLPQQLAVAQAQAQAVALDVANPATPSTAAPTKPPL
jgi:uncharacterized protein (TIGR02594 family)